MYGFYAVVDGFSNDVVESDAVDGDCSIVSDTNYIDSLDVLSESYVSHTDFYNYSGYIIICYTHGRDFLMHSIDLNICFPSFFLRSQIHLISDNVYLDG